jgi:thioredoxin-related protein
MKIIKFVVLTFLLAGSTYAVTSQKTGVLTGGVAHTMPTWFKNSFLDITEDIEEANDANKHVLLFFHLDNCPYCNQTIEDFNQPTTRNFLQENFDVIAINIRGDKEVALDEDTFLTEKHLAEKVGVRYTPTLLFLNADNQMVARSNGYRNPGQLKKILNYVSSRAYDTQTLAQYIEQEKSANTYQFIYNDIFQNIEDFSKINTPIAVIFEDKSCSACSYFHTNILKNPLVKKALQNFIVVRLDAQSTQEVIDNTHQKTTIKDWVNRLKLTYHPGVILLNENQEITRIDGFLHPFHFSEMLNYVSGSFYKQYETFGAFLSYKQKKLLAEGVDININAQPLNP